METIGIIAAILTTSAFVPQAFKTIKTRRTEDLSLSTFSMILVGTILWFVYGLSIEDKPLIFANGITACLSAVIVFLKLNAMAKARR